jgi:quercetin dioxygenase-like cupin family protein
MYLTEEQVRENLKYLPDIPVGLIYLKDPEDFHGITNWKTICGMESYKALDHFNAEIFHTKFNPYTEVCWHNHGECSKEIIICLSGEIAILFEDGSQKTLKETDDLKIRKQINHMAVIGDKPCEIIAITIPKEK